MLKIAKMRNGGDKNGSRLNMGYTSLLSFVLVDFDGYDGVKQVLAQNASILGNFSAHLFIGNLIAR